MTLTTYPDVEQGSERWHDLRRGIVTASTIGKLITSKTLKVASNDDSRGLTMLLASERITGWTYPTYQSLDMLRGTLDEPVARNEYASDYAPFIGASPVRYPVEELGFMEQVFDDGRRIGYSPDGLVGDFALIEIKSRRPKQQLETFVTDEVPLENMAQIQCGLFVSGREFCDYVSFCGGMPLYVKRVFPDLRWWEVIVLAAQKLEENIAEMIATYTDAVDGLRVTERIDHDTAGITF